MSVLLIDDHPEAMAAVAGDLAVTGARILRAAGACEGWRAFQREAPDLVVPVVRTLDADGFALLGRIREVSDVPVVLLTARGEVPSAVAALRRGADDYLQFPDDLARLERRVARLVAERGAEPDDVAGRAFPGPSEAARALRIRIRALAPLPVPVLVSGEPGSGRARAVFALHELADVSSPLSVATPSRPDAPCDASAVLLRDLDCFESVHRQRWRARLESAEGDGGPRLFATVQPGSSVPADSRFRLDVPPLRERTADHEYLVRHLLAECSARLDRRPIHATAAALHWVREQPWPGNLSELAEVLTQAVVLSRGDRIGIADVRGAFDQVLRGRSDSLASRRAEKRRREREELVALLEECGGNIAEMARRLDLTRGAVSYRLQKHGLRR